MSHSKDNHDKTKAADNVSVDTAPTDNVSPDTVPTINVSRSENVDDLWVDPAEIINDVILADELERVAKLVETVAISGSKCHECKMANEVVNHKVKVIKDQDSKIIALQT